MLEPMRTRSKTPKASDEETRLSQRRERNRQSAADSRERKKEVHSEMALELEALRAENTELRRLLAAAQPAAEAAAQPAAAALPGALPRVQGGFDRRDDHNAKRARKAMACEELRQTIRDEIPPTGLALAQLGRDQFPTEITMDGTQMQEVVARDGPMRRLRVGIFRDGKPIRGSDLSARGLQIRAELRYAGHTIAEPKWLDRYDAQHNPAGKQVYNTTLLVNHEVALPISIKALSSDGTLFPGTSKANPVPLKLTIGVEAAAHGGTTFGVAETTTRPFVSKAKADMARKRTEDAPRAADALGAFGGFNGTADMAAVEPEGYTSEELEAIIDEALAAAIYAPEASAVASQ